MEFKKYRLSDIADIQTGPFGSQLHKEDYVESGIPIITVEHLGENKIIHFNLPRVNKEDWERLSKYVLKKDDIVFSRVGSVDRCALVSHDEENWLFSGRCLRVRVKDLDIIDPKYLSYYFATKNFKRYIRSIAVGATMPSINTKILSEIQLEIPDIDSQRKIAELFYSLDSKKWINENIIKNLGHVSKAIFKHWFVDFEFPNEEGEPYKSSGGEMKGSLLGDIPKEWSVEFLHNDVVFLSGGTPKTKEKEYWNGSIPLFTPKDAKSNLYTTVTEKTITELGLEKCNSKLYPKNTLFITARGTVGKLALANKAMAMNQSCFALKHKEDKQFYLYHIVENLVKKIISGANGAVFSAINLNDLNHLKYAYSNEKLISNFENTVSIFYEQMSLLEEENINLQQIRDTLLPKILSGEIKIPNELEV